MEPAKTILCVDDEPPVLLMQRMMLESVGFKVLTATSGREAIRVFASEHIDLVVMDYWMPGMNGVAAANFMKQLKPHVPIVFLSAFTEFPGETVGLAQCWVKKGEEPPELFVSRLRSLVGNQGSTEQSPLAS